VWLKHEALSSNANLPTKKKKYQKSRAEGSDFLLWENGDPGKLSLSFLSKPPGLQAFSHTISH
jgi:hypothetical protein